jgi:hypothetical protein
MTFHQPSRDPWDPGVRGTDVTVVKPVSSETVFPEVLDPVTGEITSPGGPIVEHAIHYANNGWSVFPARPGEKKGIYWANEENGQRKWGQTKDANEIRRYWQENPNANVCIVTGEGSGIFVVETDTAAGHGDDVDGAASLAALEVEHGALPETLMAISPSGSVHRYFKHPDPKVINSESVIAPGVDVRGDGGMVIAPPSMMPAREAVAATPAIEATEGKLARAAKKAKPARPAGAYRWLNDLPVADAPQWLLDRNVPAKSFRQRALDTIKRPPGVDALFAGNNFWRRVKDRALDDRSAWVQALFGNIAQLKTISGMQVWRVTSQDLGRDLEEDLSIAPNGIVDFGTEEALTAIDVVMRFSSPNKTDEEAALWLCEQMGIDPKELGWNGRPADIIQLPGTKPTPEPGTKTPPSKVMPLTFFDDVENFASKIWLIKDAIAKGETSEWIAPPGKLKSALMTDLSIHIASGRDWRGYRSKETCGVVYFALERADLVKRRLTAHRKRDEVKGLPIAVAGGVIDLMHPATVDLIVSTIRAAEAKFDCSVGFVVFDTLAKGIAAGGGDENQAKDLGRALANLRRVQDQTGAHIAIVSHTGKDEKKGARGSNSQVGDVDVLVQISGDSVKVATITKANDQEEGVLTKFKGEIAVLGVDDDGDDITTMIISTEDCGSAGGKSAKPDTLTPTERRAMDLLYKAINEVGQLPPPSLPRSVVKVLPLDTWREYCKRGALSDGKADAVRMAFKRVMTSLVTKHRVETFDGMVWVAYDGVANPLDFNSAKPQ